MPPIRIAPMVGIALVALLLPVHGQISTPCSSLMFGSFTPCMNFLTNSTTNGGSPITDCCNSLKNLTSNGMDCLCLIFTGSVPFQIPINQTLAISLPRACNMPGVPVQCKASGAPLASPGPASLGPVLSPAASPSAGPSATVAPEPTQSAQPPESDTTPVLTPPSSTTQTPPTSSTGMRPILTPPTTDAAAAYSISPSLLLLTLGFMMMKFY